MNRRAFARILPGAAVGIAAAVQSAGPRIIHLPSGIYKQAHQGRYLWGHWHWQDGVRQYTPSVEQWRFFRGWRVGSAA